MNHNELEIKNLEEHLEEVEQAIADTKKTLKKYPEHVYPRENRRLQNRLHNWELTRDVLKHTLFEKIIIEGNNDL